MTGDPIGSSLQGHAAPIRLQLMPEIRAQTCSGLRCLSYPVGEGDSQRAGPTLARLYGRRIASLPGYRFSEALKHLDIVWTPETVSKLFEVGPNAYTPGTKMPEQRIGSAEDRKALTDFLARATSK